MLAGRANHRLVLGAHVVKPLVVGGKLPDYPMRAWREARNITLQEMADITGYSLSMVSRVERRKIPVSGLVKINIARACKVRVADLFGAPAPPVVAVDCGG